MSGLSLAARSLTCGAGSSVDGGESAREFEESEATEGLYRSDGPGIDVLVAVVVVVGIAEGVVSNLGF